MVFVYQDARLKTLSKMVQVNIYCTLFIASHFNNSFEITQFKVIMIHLFPAFTLNQYMNGLY